MASADELRQQLAQARASLREALQATDGAWEDVPEGEEWGAKQIAQHVIGGEVFYANIVAKAMQGKPAEFDRSEIASAEDALVRHETAAALADRAFKYVEDRDLAKPAENVAGTDDQTVGGAMAQSIAHLQEHAQQMKGV